MDFNLILPPLLLSFKTVGLSLVLFILLGIPLAYVLSQKFLRYRWILESIVTLPLIFPPIAIGFLLLLLLGRNGWVGAYFYAWDIRLFLSLKGL